MPPRQSERPKIKPLPQDWDRNRLETINEQAEAQASAAGSSSIATPPVVDPNLVEAIMALARVIPTLIAPTKKRIADYCKDLKNMGCKIFTRSLELDLA